MGRQFKPRLSEYLCLICKSLHADPVWFLYITDAECAFCFTLAALHRAKVLPVRTHAIAADDNIPVRSGKISDQFFCSLFVEPVISI